MPSAFIITLSAIMTWRVAPRSSGSPVRPANAFTRSCSGNQSSSFALPKRRIHSATVALVRPG